MILCAIRRRCIIEKYIITTICKINIIILMDILIRVYGYLQKCIFRRTCTWISRVNGRGPSMKVIQTGYNIIVIAPSTVWFFQCRWPANEPVCRRKTARCPFYAVSSSPTYCRHWRRFQTEVANRRYPSAPRTRPSDWPSLRHH